MTFPGGMSHTFQYDALLRVEQINAPEAGMNYSYTYDHVSNILTKTTEHGNYGYEYDEVSRLTTADNPTLDAEAYTYDGVGNRETASNATGSISHTANNELLVYGEVEYEYDANGNLTRKALGTATVNYSYNAANRLIRVEDELSGLVIAEYGYDPFGRRLWKEVDGVRTYFLYADEGLAAEYDEQGNELRSYGWQPDSTWGTHPLWLKQDGEYYWYQNDHLGMPHKLIDSTGTAIWEARYDAFGNAEILVETVVNNLRFPGQYYDAETGLHYNFHRYYDPETGRYLRPDPLRIPESVFNLYAYVGMNPVNRLDPTGLFTASDLANWYDQQVSTSVSGLNNLTAESVNPFTHVGSATLQVAMMIAGGFVDMLRLGEGVVEGGWGYGKDALRLGGLLSIGAQALQAARGGTTTVCGIAEAAELSPAHLGISEKNFVQGTLSLVDDTAIANVEYLIAEIDEPFRVLKNLVEAAKSMGAKNLRIEATIGNKDLYRILTTRYGFIGEFGSPAVLEIPIL